MYLLRLPVHQHFSRSWYSSRS